VHFIVRLRGLKDTQPYDTWRRAFHVIFIFPRASLSRDLDYGKRVLIRGINDYTRPNLCFSEYFRPLQDLLAGAGNERVLLV